MRTLRAQLKQQYGLPSKTEIHAGPMLRGNEPYRTLMGLATRPALASAFLMDYLKSRAPFWKKEHLISGDAAGWVEAKAEDDAAADRWRR